MIGLALRYTAVGFEQRPYCLTREYWAKSGQASVRKTWSRGSVFDRVGGASSDEAAAKASRKQAGSAKSRIANIKRIFNIVSKSTKEATKVCWQCLTRGREAPTLGRQGHCSPSLLMMFSAFSCQTVVSNSLFMCDCACNTLSKSSIWISQN